VPPYGREICSIKNVLCEHFVTEAGISGSARCVRVALLIFSAGFDCPAPEELLSAKNHESPAG